MIMEGRLEPEWLREAIRFAMSPSAPYTSSADAGPPIRKDPRFRKIVEGVLFSRKFILTYHLVIFGFIAVVSIAHWSKKLTRWRRRQAFRQGLRYEIITNDEETCKTLPHEYGVSTPGSGSSSSHESSAHPPEIQDINEDTPLLQKSKHIRSLYRRRRFISTFKSLLMYQPPPIPIVNRVLPSNGCSLAILLFLVVFNFYQVFYINNLDIDQLFVFADRAGLLFIANLPWLYLLAAKTQPLKILTGSSYESLNIFHRRLGEIMILTGVVHGAGMFGVWYTLLRPTGFTLNRFLSANIVLLGIGTLCAYILILLTSIREFRQMWYEMFLGVHIILQTSALILLFFHHHNSRPYVGVALGIFFLDRIAFRLGLKSITSKAEVRVMEDGETVLISTVLPLKEENLLSSIIRRNVLGGWEATDHVFVSIPSLASKHILQAHPFSIIAPASLGKYEERRLDLLIRAQDGFSADLLKEARKRNSFTIRVDGPYGSSNARDLLQDSDLALIVAGGSGIAIAWPLVHFLLHLNRSNDTEVLSADEILKQKIVLIWVVHKESHLSWIGQPALQEIRDSGVEVIIPKATEEVGRPDIDVMMNDVVSKYSDRKRIGVVVSGPDTMNRTVRNECSSLVLNGLDVGVAVEKYGW